MRGMRRFVFVLVIAGMASGAFAAKEGRRRRGKQPEESLYDLLMRECKLTDKQQTAVKEKIKARDAVLAAWDKANAEKVQAAENAAKDAKDKNDGDARKQASRNLRDLRTAREESAAAATAAIFAVLTDEQKAAWDTHELFKATAGRYRRAELTEEQLAKVKTACAIAAKELAEIEPFESKAKKLRSEITRKLQWAIHALVLTAEQRQATARKPARGGGKDRN